MAAQQTLSELLHASPFKYAWLAGKMGLLPNSFRNIVCGSVTMTDERAEQLAGLIGKTVKAVRDCADHSRRLWLRRQQKELK